MKVIAVNHYGENQEKLEVVFKLPNKSLITVGRTEKKWYVEVNGQNTDRVQEAIEIVKSGKLLIEL
jgi:hypothetical protein